MAIKHLANVSSCTDVQQQEKQQENRCSISYFYTPLDLYSIDE